MMDKNAKNRPSDTSKPSKPSRKVRLLSIEELDAIVGGATDDGGVGAMGPRSDCGAGDAEAWNEGDITLAEAGE